MPLGLNPHNFSLWTPILDKFRSNLSSWKSKCLNQADKLIVLKATLDSLPIYWFTLFVIPRQVQLEIDKLRHGFFWEDIFTDGIYKRKLHSLSWSLLCQQKNFGGLNIANLKERIEAMIAKWHWRLVVERGSLWSSLLEKLYGEEIYFELFHLQEDKQMSPVFKDILRLKNWPELSSIIDSSNFVWSLINCRSSLFWHDNWHYYGPLKYFFSGIFSLSKFQNETIAALKWKLEHEGVSDSFWWKRSLEFRERVEANSFFELLNSRHLHQERTFSFGPRIRTCSPLMNAISEFSTIIISLYSGPNFGGLKFP